MTNIYDEEKFFQQYAQMTRSKEGLSGAGEWHQLKEILPPFIGKKVLDLGCGYGWHCKYAAVQGAETVLGIDMSHRMMEEAEKRNSDEKITYRICGLEEYEYPQEAWDIVISNLVLHYIADLKGIFRKIYQTLKPGGEFIFNIEHPVFTAGVGQDWIYDEENRPLYWPVDNYYTEGTRSIQFLGFRVEKQHHTLTSIIESILEVGFKLEAFREATPPEDMMDIPGMADELRRPMMLLVKVKKE